MYAPTDTTVPTPPRIPPQSFLVKILLSRGRSYRHPHFWIRVRLACAIWNLVLGLALLSSAHWIGQYAWLGLLPLAGSALLFTTVAHLRRYIRSEASSTSATRRP